MRDSWRRIVGALAIPVVAWLALWTSASALAPRALDRAIPQLIAHAGRLGVEITELSVPVVRIAPTLSSVTIDGLSARFDLSPGDDKQLRSQITVDELRVRLRNPIALRGSIRADGVEISLDESDLPASLPFDRFTNGTIVIMDLPLTRPGQAVGEIRAGLEQLFAMNEVTGAALFEGDVKIPFEDGAMVAHLYTERDGDRFRLRFRESDIQAISEHKQLDLAPEQVALVSLYPLRVPALMVITERARRLSRQHEPRDVWLRDASRHVLWSYLLTQQFGADFARQVIVRLRSI